MPSGTLTDEKKRAEASGSFAKKPSPRVPSGTDTQLEKPRPKGARPGATPGDGRHLDKLGFARAGSEAHISVCQPATKPAQRKFGIAPIPLRLFISPVGVPSGTAEAGDLKVAIVPAQNSISCLPPRTAVSKRRAADATPGGRPVPLGKTDWRQQKNYDSQ